MTLKLMRYVLWNGGKWYARKRMVAPAKVFAVLAGVTVAATVAYVVASGGGDEPPSSLDHSPQA